MLPELTNLLPARRLQAFRKQYFLRLTTVALIAAALLVILHALLLLPTYLYARSEAARGREEVAALDAASQTSEEQEVAARAALLKSTAAYLTRLESSPEASAVLRAVLAVPRPGIALTGFTYAAPAGNTPGRLGVTGIASSRDALRSYATLLSALPFVTSADLPISAYAKERDIEFIITLTGSLKP